jgi:hypothetical protein
MKSRKAHVTVAALLAIGCAFWLLTRGGQPEKVNPQTPKTQPTPAASPSASPTYLSTTAPRQEPGGPYAPADPRWEERRRKRAEDPKYEWKTPIEFYGKVLDQDGKPVVGAIADVIWTDMSANGSSTLQITSDLSGLFSITGIRGKHMTVQVNKEGYHRQLSGTTSAFEYAGFWEPSYHVPDKKNPVIFRLRKKGEPAALLRFGPTLFGAKPDGTPVVFDLATGRKSSGNGQVSVSVKKATRNAERQFDWEVTLEAVGSGAGLLESKDEFMVEAPENGYQQTWKFAQKAGAEGFQSEMQAKFFVKTAGGQFARIEVRVLPEYNEMAAVDLASYFNPEPGNRNLEFDPAKAAPAR